MNRSRKTLAIAAALVVMALICSARSRGEPDQKDGPVVRPVAAAPERQADQDVAASKFDQGGIITYKTLKGETLFALQVKPQLPAVPVRKRDYLIIVCNTAAQAGEPGIATAQIADAVIETAGPDDRVSLWVLSTPDHTKPLFTGFLHVKEDRHKLSKAIDRLKNKEFPAGDADLKTGLARAIKTFDVGEDRQRILLYLGDGQSVHNPIDGADRQALIQTMVKERIAFFPVPLGLSFDASNLHGFATGTGGAVLRTRVAEEKLPEALKRYQDAFAGAILYDARLKLPPTVTQVFPKNLPPLRADVPTLVVGHINDAKSLNFTVSGTVDGRPGALNLDTTEKVPEAELDNYFLVSVVNQWERAQTQPALIRADRALVLAYNNTRLLHDERLAEAQLALETNHVDAALRLYEEARALAPHDPEAAAGIKICSSLKDGKLTPALLKTQLDKAGRNADKVEKVNGVVRVSKIDLVQLAQLEQKEEAVRKAPGRNAPGAADRDDLLQIHRDQVIVEEQKMKQIVETALAQARKELAGDPEGTLDYLRNTLSRVRNHPNLSDDMRHALQARLETSLREITNTGRALKLRKEEKSKVAAVVQKNQELERERLTIENRAEAQFRIYKNLMNIARLEEHAKIEVLRGLEEITFEARRQGRADPLAAIAAYNQVSAAFSLQRARDLNQLKERRFLEVYLSVERSAVPFSDEPGIYFPPLKTWQAISALRKEKYEVSSLPDDEKGRKEAKSIAAMLTETIKTSDIPQTATLKDVLGLFIERMAEKGKELPILIDTNAFKEDAADAPDPYDTTVKFPPYPKTMSLATALRFALSQIPSNNATYLIRRNYIEVTTNDRMVREKVLRVYPVGDLVIPISQSGGTQNFNFGGGGQQTGGQMPQFGQLGGQIGQFGLGALGMNQFGGPLGAGALGNAFGQQNFGVQLGAIGGPFGQFGPGAQVGFGAVGQFGPGPQIGFGALMAGGFGQPVGQLGNFQGVGGSFNGGSFQGGFNGSLGALGASQAVSLISVITKVVAPGEWFVTQQPNPFQQNIFAPFMGGRGMMGVNFQMMGGPVNGFGGGPPPAPVNEGGPADIQKANTIEFFPPALAIIVRGTSRIHTSLYGGIIGGKRPPMEAAMLDAREKGLVFVARGGQIIDPNAAPGAAGKTGVASKVIQPDLKKTPAELDATTVWNEALAKGGVDAGMVVATADFLFEAGQYQHAAEFLKANLRAGIVIRPWVYEALAVALEASGGEPDEIRRARLSAVSLDPTDAQGFLQAARTLADHKQYDRALAFCRQAALLEPNASQPYAEALAYAELGKDSKAMAWAAEKLISQDWAEGNQFLQQNAQSRGQALAQSLRADRRGTEADQLQQALQALRQRDLVINLTWDSSGEPADLELEVKEPTGSVCSAQQKQTPGGGTFLGTNLTDMTRASYLAAQAFPGEYEISVRRLFGQPLGGRARLEIIQNLGTPQETRRLEIVRLNRPAHIRIDIKAGRRTELATVAPPMHKKASAKAEAKAENVLMKLRGFSFPEFSGSIKVRGEVSTPGGNRPSLPAAAYQSQTTALGGSGGINITAQVKMSPDQRETNLVLQPVFQTVIGNRPSMSLPLIPGAGPAR